MRIKVPVVLMLAAFAAASLSAHIMVSPPQSKVGKTQKYELRVHNEAKVAATSIELEVPDGVTVIDVAKPATGSVTTKKAGDRITAITWQVEVAPNRYMPLPFTAKNPDSGTALHWNVRERLADGSVVDWSDKPGAKEKASVTTLGPAS
jgi:uncharacterized protein YcnI